MLYAMSDLHGEYQKYLAMLEKIKFSQEDTLYLLGDLVDRGPEPVKILQDIMQRPNVYPLLGNHEVMAVYILKQLLLEVTEETISQVDTYLMENIFIWQRNGGGVTLEQFQALPPRERRQLLEFMEGFGWYETVDVGERAFLLVHAGLGNYRPGKKLEEYSLEELTMVRPDYQTQYFPDDSIYVLSGHTPTKLLSGKWEIYRSHNNIVLDCGAAIGGRLACLCLDTMEEFYL